jgi:hypothetical protein
MQQFMVFGKIIYSGVQRINNVFHIVDKVENVCVNKYIFDLIDNVEYVVYALYSSIFEKKNLTKKSNFFCPYWSTTRKQRIPNCQ